MGYVRLKQITAETIDELASAMQFESTEQMLEEFAMEPEELYDRWADFSKDDGEYLPELPSGCLKARIQPIFIYCAQRCYYEEADGWLNPDGCAYLTEDAYLEIAT